MGNNMSEQAQSVTAERRKDGGRQEEVDLPFCTGTQCRAKGKPIGEQVLGVQFMVTLI